MRNVNSPPQFPLPHIFPIFVPSSLFSTTYGIFSSRVIRIIANFDISFSVRSRTHRTPVIKAQVCTHQRRFACCFLGLQLWFQYNISISFSLSY